jgi:serine/threonine-protein kinase
MAAEDVFGIVGTTQAGNFHVERVVAEGGFGVVYRALHGGFRAPVAIKCLKIPDQMSKQHRDVFLEKFREEAELMFRLSGAIAEVCRPLHVDVLQLGDGRFVPFLAMEWLEGESLDAIVTRRREQGLPPLGLHKVVKMLRPVAMALHKAHRFPGPQGAMAIIHRDLKPENLMFATIAGAESMKILDFGIAKAKRAATQAVGRLTGRAIAEDEMASFTPAYGAPEQWVPKSWGETGPWTDVWGLALTMVEALTGVPPIDGEPWAMRRICLDDKRRPTPRNHGADVPMEVEKVFEQALALDPRKRYKTIESFWSELEKAMGLVPSLGPRDDRREPGEHSGEEGQQAPATSARSAEVPGGLAPRARVELARINLQAAARPVKAPLVAMAPPRPAGEPSGSWEFDLTAATTSGAADLEADLNGQALEARRPAKAHDEPSGNELATASPVATKSPVAAVPARPEPAVTAPSATATPRPALPAPPVRRRSGELELDLPTRSDRSPPMSAGPASLEMSLPTRSEPPPPAPEPAPAPRDARDDAARAPKAAPADGPRAFDLQPSRPAARSDPSVAAPLPPSAAFTLSPGPQRRPDLATRPQYTGPRRSLGERLRAPLGILVAAILVATIEVGYHKLGGGDLMFGPVRPFWIAAPLAIFGVGLTLWRMMEDHGDE